MLKQIKGKINSGEIETRTEGKTYLIKFFSLPKGIKERYEGSQKKAVEQAKILVEKPQKDLNFEKDLWAAADKLRGNIDPSEYKYIVLGLIFLKYVSDSFYQQRERLQKWMGDSSNKQYYVPNEKSRGKMLEDKEMYKRENVFYIPEVARWEFLRGRASLNDIAKYIEEAMEAIEKENSEQLSGVLPKNFVRIPLEPYVIGELINIFSRIEFDHDENKEKDMLGRVYEYFLGQFASAEGKRGGEFFTPRPLVKLLVEILEPFENSRVLDPAAGSGGMFVQASNFLKEHHKDPNKIAIYGQESNDTTLKLCKMNLAIRGVFGKIEFGNSYYDDKFRELKADFVFANPPFNAEWGPDRVPEKDPRIVYGTPPASNANFMWIQHFIHHLAPNGMAGFVMANGALAVGGKEGKIREKIIENDLIDVIIACPPKLFYNVSLPVSLWFLTKNKESGRFRNRKGETLFIDARETFTQISRKQVTFTDEQIQKIANAARAWRGQNEAGKYEDVPGFCKSVKLEEIAKNGYALSPGRYVGVPEEGDDGIPFAEKIKTLQKDLGKYFAENEKLEKEILENMKKIKI
ncbi:N-6 DNA methylase [Candidatus Woesebacteria bacterium]|nr:N-6 DNA methylase [Candidatus Woesebacteria bacterium]